jgi:hypothetical protein
MHAASQVQIKLVSDTSKESVMNRLQEKVENRVFEFAPIGHNSHQPTEQRPPHTLRVLASMVGAHFDRIRES